ncbi:hypothetical protein P7K49_024172 [Saguinus oedipus]|uniref:Uncharacterized protein n=1 Tax=Saguinus oedipus TaxID=9490 RepID=A0ABQ9UPF6_SAGOE|nr:hypothetical protein P7K49_024172 [Saguinus oedipus]
MAHQPNAPRDLLIVSGESSSRPNSSIPCVQEVRMVPDLRDVPCTLLQLNLLDENMHIQNAQAFRIISQVLGFSWAQFWPITFRTIKKQNLPISRCKSSITILGQSLGILREVSTTSVSRGCSQKPSPTQSSVSNE